MTKKLNRKISIIIHCRRVGSQLGVFSLIDQLRQPKGADLKIFTSQNKTPKERSHKNLLRDNSQ